MTRGWLIGLVLMGSCAVPPPVLPQPPDITGIYLDQSWGDSLLVCVQPTLTYRDIQWQCIRLGDLRRSFAGARQARITP